MRITFCGTAAGVNSQRRANAGIVLQADGRTVMLDCGGGSVREAVRAGIAPRSIEAVLLSHLHQDHCVDLAFLVADRNFARLPQPMVYGPPGVESFVRGGAAYVEAMAHAFRGPPPCTEVRDGDQQEATGFMVRWAETPHAPDLVALAQRVGVGGKTVVYSGDTQPAPGVMVPLAEGADLLIHECYSRPTIERMAATLPAEQGEYLSHFTAAHSEVEAVAAIAREAGARRLVLTHFLQAEDLDYVHATAVRIFNGEVVIAHDGLTLDV